MEEHGKDCPTRQGLINDVLLPRWLTYNGNPVGNDKVNKSNRFKSEVKDFLEWSERVTGRTLEQIVAPKTPERKLAEPLRFLPIVANHIAVQSTNNPSNQQTNKKPIASVSKAMLGQEPLLTPGSSIFASSAMIHKLSPLNIYEADVRPDLGYDVKKYGKDAALLVAEVIVGDSFRFNKNFIKDDFDPDTTREFVRDNSAMISGIERGKGVKEFEVILRTARNDRINRRENVGEVDEYLRQLAMLYMGSEAKGRALHNRAIKGNKEIASSQAPRNDELQKANAAWKAQFRLPTFVAPADIPAAVKAYIIKVAGSRPGDLALLAKGFARGDLPNIPEISGLRVRWYVDRNYGNIFGPLVITAIAQQEQNISQYKLEISTLPFGHLVTTPWIVPVFHPGSSVACMSSLIQKGMAIDWSDYVTVAYWYKKMTKILSNLSGRWPLHFLAL